MGNEPRRCAASMDDTEVMNGFARSVDATYIGRGIGMHRTTDHGYIG